MCTSGLNFSTVSLATLRTPQLDLRSHHCKEKPSIKKDLPTLLSCPRVLSETEIVGSSCSSQSYQDQSTLQA